MQCWGRDRQSSKHIKFLISVMQLVWEDNWNKWKPIWCHVIKGIIKHKPERNKVRGKSLLFPHFWLLTCQNLRKKVPLCGKILLCTTEGPTKLLLLEGRRLPTHVVRSLTQGKRGTILKGTGASFCSDDTEFSRTKISLLLKMVTWSYNQTTWWIEKWD